MHMIQHLLLTDVCPPLLLLGAPLILIVAAPPQAIGKRISLVMRSAPVKFVTSPPFAWCAFVGTLWGIHYTPLFGLALENDGIHEFMHVLFLSSALLFWIPIVAEPAFSTGRAFTYPLRLLYVFGAMLARDRTGLLDLQRAGRALRALRRLRAPLRHERPGRPAGCGADPVRRRRPPHVRRPHLHRRPMGARIRPRGATFRRAARSNGRVVSHPPRRSFILNLEVRIMHRKHWLIATILVVLLSGTCVEAKDPPLPTGIKIATMGDMSMFTDAKGLTLYVLDTDTDGKSTCYATCAQNWPPLLAGADAKPVGDFTIITRDDDTKQWAYKGKPLYYFKNDAQPMDMKGDGLGGKWHVARP